MERSAILPFDPRQTPAAQHTSAVAPHLPLSALLATCPARARSPWRVAVVGAGAASDPLIGRLRRLSRRRLTLLGVFDERGCRRDAPTQQVGSITDLLDAAHRRPIDRVLIALPQATSARVEQIASQLAPLSAVVAHCETVATPLAARPPWRIEDVGVRLLGTRTRRRWDAPLKRGMDLLLAIPITLAALPLLAVLATLVKLDSPGPVLFRQRRHGLDEREFKILKFRSMRWQSAHAAPLVQTSRGDARVTTLGRVLRRSSLDELPQLFNVLRGEMSLVGPRPHALDMRTEGRLCAEIVPAYAQRHRVRPGLTGWAQVRGLRGATQHTAQLRRRIDHDLAYIDNWSPWLDLKILAMTLTTLLRGTNAY